MVVAMGMNFSSIAIEGEEFNGQFIQHSFIYSLSYDVPFFSLSFCLFVLSCHNDNCN